MQEEICCLQIGNAVSLGDASGLANCIREMAQNPQMCHQMGVRAGELYEQQYASEIGQGKYRQVFERLLQ